MVFILSVPSSQGLGLTLGWGHLNSEDAGVRSYLVEMLFDKVRCHRDLISPATKIICAHDLKSLCLEIRTVKIREEPNLGAPFV